MPANQKPKNQPYSHPTQIFYYNKTDDRYGHPKPENYQSDKETGFNFSNSIKLFIRDNFWLEHYLLKKISKIDRFWLKQYIKTYHT